MMGRLKSEQTQLFYQFKLDDAVPEDHLVRKIDAALDLSWLRSELAPHYSSMGRPSIDPELMIRTLVVGYVFAIRSERLICREVQVDHRHGRGPREPVERWARQTHCFRVRCSRNIFSSIAQLFRDSRGDDRKDDNKTNRLCPYADFPADGRLCRVFGALYVCCTHRCPISSRGRKRFKTARARHRSYCYRNSSGHP
jgi:hypothetical protein